MAKTLADTIKEITFIHLNKDKGIIMGQCLSAVGWVQNTIPPQKKGVIELQMTDTAGAGFAVGSALAGARPILVLRFEAENKTRLQEIQAVIESEIENQRSLLN